MALSIVNQDSDGGDGPERVRRRVLVVDDDPNVASLLGAALETEGHVVRCATHSLRVYDAAQEFKPNLILMDLGLPYLDGFDQIRLLGLDEALADVPVVLVTANRDALAMLETLAEPLKRRVVDCIYKPLDLDVLLEKVAALPMRWGDASGDEPAV